VNSVQEAYDRYAAVYDELLAHSEIRRDVWEIADRFFTEGMRLLDLGCGTGDDAIHFAQRGLFVSAVDVSPVMIERLKLK
jgi:ubiquinone/menaquinone biosynthesis C-methylase UbiE